METIITLTMNPSVDVSTSVNRIEPTSKLRGTYCRREPGGGGINVARVVDALGGRAMALYLSGGGTGSVLNEMLNRAGIAIRPLAVKSMTRESFSVRDEESGLLCRFVLPGERLADWECETCIEALDEFRHQGGYLVVSGSLPDGAPEDFYGRVAHRFSETGTRVVLDSSGPPLRLALGCGLYLIKPNRRELEELCGRSLEKFADQEKVCRRLVADGACEVVVLSLGKDGALLTTATHQERLPAFPLEVKSAIGAGDSFVGGMVLGLSRGWSIAKAFRQGMAAASAALLTPGTQLCSREQTMSFFSSLQGEEGARLYQMG